MTFKQFFDLYGYTCRVKRSDQRDGQVLCNMLWYARHDLSSKLTVAGLNPFYVESRVPRAIDWIQLNWSTK